VTRAQQQQPRQSLSKFTSAEKQWRWFGFHATACSQQATPQTEYISLAVYDLDSGDFYSTLINPKLHNPGYRFTSARLKGGQCVAMLHSALDSGSNKGGGGLWHSLSEGYANFGMLAQQSNTMCSTSQPVPSIGLHENICAEGVYTAA